jgi:hypothetical protein
MKGEFVIRMAHASISIFSLGKSFNEMLSKEGVSQVIAPKR